MNGVPGLRPEERGYWRFADGNQRLMKPVGVAQVLAGATTKAASQKVSMKCACCCCAEFRLRHERMTFDGLPVKAI